ncbi:MAG: triphosphoribosyl-dephospho-CoA synthase [Pirellulales bacterium]
MTTPLSIGQCATLACLLEVTAPKVGNVHRGADFEDLTFGDFAVSAVAIGPALEAAGTTGVGAACLAAIRATRRLVSTNTNLGIVLLLAPLAAVPRGRPLADGVGEVLAALSAQDSHDVYEAIRLAHPGGLGEVADMDVQAAAPPQLLDAMRAAADRDLVARQYVEQYRHVFQLLVPWLVADLSAGRSLIDAIVHAQIQLLAAEGDSLIERKGGSRLARQVQELARAVLRAGEVGSDEYYQALGDLDFWLRADGHRRNPGTTADLLAAALFVLLRDPPQPLGTWLVSPTGWRPLPESRAAE